MSFYLCVKFPTSCLVYFRTDLQLFIRGVNSTEYKMKGKRWKQYGSVILNLPNTKWKEKRWKEKQKHEIILIEKPRMVSLKVKGLHRSTSTCYMVVTNLVNFNTSKPRQNGRHFTDDIFKCIFFNEKVWISITLSLKFVPKGPITNIPTLVQIMVWRRPGDKPLSEPMMVSFLMHIYVTRPQWVNMQLQSIIWTKLCQRQMYAAP